MQKKVTINIPEPHSENQRKLIMAFVEPQYEEIWISCGTKWGKPLAQVTDIITLNGWKKFGDIKEGDYVFDENGKPVLVEYVTDPMYGHECYEMVFSDGSKIIADADHLWVTSTHLERKAMARAKSPKDRCKSTNAKPQTRTTKEIFDTQTFNVAGKPRANHAIPLVTAPLELPKKALLLDPYVLGSWLASSSTASGGYTGLDVEIVEEIRKAGFDVSDYKEPKAWYVKNLAPILRKLDIFYEKKIPPKYLSASKEDRLALIQGMLDGDGTIDERGISSFDNTNKNLVEGLRILLATMGVKAAITSRIGKLNGVEKKVCYRLRFTTDVPVFRLKRKAEKLRPVAIKNKQRTIEAVNPVPSVPVMCIRVANPTHLFLIGESCIPTHNTTGASAALAAAAPLVKSSLWRWVAPIFTQSKIGFNHCRKMLPTEPYCTINRSQLPTITINQMDSRIEFWHGQNAESLEGEAVFGYVFDEAAKMSEGVYDSAHTTTTITRGPKVAISTPKGKNWFYRKCMEAHEEYTWAIETGRKPKKIFITAPSTDNPAVTPEAIAQARAALPERLFKQYYEAHFVDDGDTFSNYKQCLYGNELEVSGSRQIWFNEQKKNDGKLQCDVVIGVDWAKKVDFTVMTAWDYKENRMVGFLRFQNVNYFEAIKQLVWFTRHFKKVDMIYHDKTGLGEVIDDMLDKTTLPYEGVIFSNMSKSNMVNSLILACEQEIPLLPRWPEMIKEMDSYEVTTTEAGSMKYSAPEGMHDDIVSSMILGWKAVLEYSEQELSVKTVETLASDDKLTVADWYKELEQQHDEEFGGWIDLKGLR